ncbi:MAG: GDP-mannose 4,6-dehydratase [Candidatus Woykebacteria bacterium]
MRKIKGKSILVTGGAGFIGSHLVDELITKGAGKIIVVDNFFLGKEENLQEAKKFRGFKLYREDATNYGVMENIIDKENIDVVFNLATKALLHTFVDADDAYIVNVDIASVLLRLLHKSRYKTLIHFSSSEAYGTAKYVPIDENHPLFPETLYAAGKASADLMVHSYHQTFGLDVATVRPFNTYGPRQNEGTYAAVIPITIKRILNKEKPVLEGDGNQTRDFTLVTEVVEATIKTYENDKTVGKVINVASGKEAKIKDIITTICKLLEYKGSWEKKPIRPADVRRHLANISLARKLLKYQPKVSLKIGLQETVSWYVKKLKR